MNIRPNLILSLAAVYEFPQPELQTRDPVDDPKTMVKFSLQANSSQPATNRICLPSVRPTARSVRKMWKTWSRFFSEVCSDRRHAAAARKIYDIGVGCSCNSVPLLIPLS